MKEIGGYIEFNSFNGSCIYENALKFNYARNCLRWLIKRRKITKLAIPKYICESVEKACKEEKVEVIYYHINESFLPNDVILADDLWVYIVNYYGQITNNDIRFMKTKYKNIIVDNVQAFFASPVEGIDTIYSCRKFLGVADGAFLCSDLAEDDDLEIDVSYAKMEYLLGRFEKTGSDFYEEYNHMESSADNSKIRKMSKLTLNLLKSFDYDYIRKKRADNYAYLDGKLKEINKLKLITPDGPFMYPFYHERGVAIRRKLISLKIYIPILWPEVFEKCNESDIEYMLAQNILPLPVDQRYDLDDMEYMIDVIMELVKEQEKNEESNNFGSNR